MKTKRRVIKQLILGHLFCLLERKGFDDLIKFLQESDFFEAPASTKFHLNYPGGLAEHSLNVFNILESKCKEYNLKVDIDTMRICGLLHDVCKVNYYEAVYDYEDTGLATYEVNDQLPLGHGEKSIAVLQKFIKLTDEELCAIRWHMIAFDAGIHFKYPTGYAFRAATKKYPLIVALFTSDYEASELIEKRKEVRSNEIKS